MLGGYGSWNSLSTLIAPYYLFFVQSALNLLSIWYVFKINHAIFVFFMFGICGVLYVRWEAETWPPWKSSNAFYFSPSLTHCSCWHDSLSAHWKHYTLFTLFFLLFTARVENLLPFSVLVKLHYFMRMSCSKQTRVIVIVNIPLVVFFHSVLNLLIKRNMMLYRRRRWHRGGRVRCLLEATLMNRFCSACTASRYNLSFSGFSFPLIQP